MLFIKYTCSRDNNYLIVQVNGDSSRDCTGQYSTVVQSNIGTLSNVSFTNITACSCEVKLALLL